MSKSKHDACIGTMEGVSAVSDCNFLFSGTFSPIIMISGIINRKLILNDRMVQKVPGT